MASADAGISVARLIPNPWVFLEATGEVFRGDSGELFQSAKRSDVSYVGHLRGYHDISESTNVDLGASLRLWPQPSGVVNGVDMGRFTTDLFGVDATVRWRPLQRAIYHSFIGRTEAVWSRREQFGGTQTRDGLLSCRATISSDDGGSRDCDSIVPTARTSIDANDTGQSAHR